MPITRHATVHSMSQRLSAIVMDLDGTLIDSAPDLHAAANALLIENGCEPLSLAAVTGMIGDGMGKLVERAFKAAGRPIDASERPTLLRRFREHYEGPGCAHLTRPYPEVAETLAALRQAGLRIGVCTNKAETAAVAVLDRLDLSRFLDAVVGGDEVPAQKPDPGHVLAVLARLDVPAARAVMVGDGPNDIAAGAAAGLPVVAVSWGYTLGVPPRELGADLIINRFGDLPAALDRLAEMRSAATEAASATPAV